MGRDVWLVVIVSRKITGEDFENSHSSREGDFGSVVISVPEPHEYRTVTAHVPPQPIPRSRSSSTVRSEALTSHSFAPAGHSRRPRADALPCAFARCVARTGYAIRTNRSGARASRTEATPAEGLLATVRGMSIAVSNANEKHSRLGRDVGGCSRLGGLKGAVRSRLCSRISDPSRRAVCAEMSLSDRERAGAF